jgi:acyl carrier protein
VADETGAAVAADSTAVGEVLIRGPTTFQGYWQNPQASTDAFNAAGWFRTGDLATQRPDGFLCVVDRKKDMILCGGENVYCSEVEAVLISHPAVAQVAVFGVPNVVMGELVAAAVVLKTPEQLQQAVTGAPNSSGSITAAAAAAAVLAGVQKQLTEWCRSRLAHYKVPSQVHVVEAMPVTGSGKILKTELRQRFAAAGPAKPAAAPTGPARPAAAAAAGRSTAAAQPVSSAIQQQQQQVPLSAADSAATLDLQVAAALAQGLGVPPPLVDADKDTLVLTGGHGYVVPVQDSSTAVQQVQNALFKGARHLLLVTCDELPPYTLSALEALLQEYSAQAVVALVDAGATSDCQLLAGVLLDAAQGMPCPRTVLASSLFSEHPRAAQHLEPVISPAHLSAAAAFALGTATVAVGPGMAAGGQHTTASSAALSSSGTYVLVLSEASAVQQVQAAVDAGAGHLVLLTSCQLSADVLSSIKLVLDPAGAAGTVALVDAATVSSSSGLAYALFDAAAGMPPVAAVLLADPATAAAPAAPTGPTQQLAMTAAAAADSTASREDAVTDAIKAAIADLLGPDAASSIRLDDPLMSSGVNSTTAVALTTLLETRLGTSLPPTLVFDYVTIRDMSGYLAGAVVATEPAAAPARVPEGPAAAVFVPSARVSSATASSAAAGASAGATAVQLVTDTVRELLGMDAAAAVDPAAPLMSVGLNSTMAVALASAMETAVGSPLPPTLVSAACYSTAMLMLV